MVISPNYEVVDVAGEVLAVPVGEYAKDNKDVFTFTNAAAYLLKKIEPRVTIEEMVTLLTSEYEVEQNTAERDVKRFINELLVIGLVEE